MPPESSSSSDLLKSLGLNLSAFERYFERPEVIESCMKQTAIEVPEFNHVPDYARVGGRLRARGYMEVCILDLWQIRLVLADALNRKNSILLTPRMSGGIASMR